MNEQWKPIPSTHGLYQVSNLGRVRSKTRTFKRKDGLVGVSRGRIIKPAPNGSGYLSFVVCINYERTTRTVHSCVIEAFKGAKPKGKEVAHLDGDKLNNTLENLAYVTHKENMQQSVAHGTSPKGERNGRSKLMAWEVREIRRMEGKAKAYMLSDQFDVSVSTITAIWRGDTWASVER
jgi:hypothetical protein